MKLSTDPSLLFIAKSALDLEWPDFPQYVCNLHAAWIAGGAKLPKHVKQLPTGEKPFIVGVSLSGKYRPLGYVAKSLNAAMLADCLILRLDEYRKNGVRDNPVVQKAMLNFPIEFAQGQLAENESMTTWMSELFAHLLTENILVESEDTAKFIRSGRPCNADVNRKLSERIDALERKLDELLNRPATTIVIGPATRSTPCAPAIGWPLPATPGDYPVVTCTNAPIFVGGHDIKPT